MSLSLGTMICVYSRRFLHSRYYVLNSILINVYFLYMFSPYYITLYLLIYYYYRTTNDNEEEEIEFVGMNNNLNK